jgi:cytochrome c oxidase subunit 2
MPDEAMSDEAMPDEAMSDEAMSDEAMSDETMSDETMSDETMSDETMSDEAMSDEAMSCLTRPWGQTRSTSTEASPGSRRPQESGARAWSEGDAPAVLSLRLRSPPRLPNSSFRAGFDSLGAVDPSVADASSEREEIPAGRRKGRRRLGAAVVALGALLLTGCQLPTFGAYKGATSQARSTFHLWQGFFIAGLIVGGFVFILILWAILRYRRRSDEMPVQTQYHTLTEIIYTILPILTVLGLFWATVVVENQVTAVEPNPYTTVHVFAFQWGWEFQYSNGVKVIGQTTDAPTMVLPTGETVRLYLRSYDVLHGFYVPEFNFSRYASPGYWTSFDLDISHNGVYRGQCTQLCGLYHSLMFFNVRSVSPRDYQTWLRTTGAFQRAHPNAIGQLPAHLHANVNGSVPSYSGGSGSSSSSGSGYGGNTGSGNTGNTGGALIGD